MSQPNAFEALTAKLAARNATADPSANPVSKQFAFKVTPEEGAAFAALVPVGCQQAYARAVFVAFTALPAAERAAFLARASAKKA